MKMGLDGLTEVESVTAEDYLLFIKFALAQDGISQRIGKYIVLCV